MATAYRRPASHFPGIFLFVLLFLAIFLGFLAWRNWPGLARSGLNPQAEPRAVAARGELSAEEQMNVEIYQEVSPSVVHVTNIEQHAGLFSLDLQRVAKGTGSGFVWDTDGHIVTNYHVVQGGNAAMVIMADQSSYEAQNIWADPDMDIAVIFIRAPSSKLQAALIGTSHDLKVGQLAFAIGNPFGLDHSMTPGIISALGREINSDTGHTIRGAIQTSAAINPGNWAPLLDSAGRLIGMNTAIISPSGGFAGVGFAIPVDEINRVVPQLIRHGKVVHPRLGVQIADDQLARQVGVDDGVLVVKVVPNGPAAQAGIRGTQRDPSGHIQLGDIILDIDGQPIHNADELYAALRKYKVDDMVTLTIMRDGEEKDVKVTLKALE